MQPDALRRPPPPLTRHELEIGVLPGERPYQQWLENALVPDRLGKRLELGLGKSLPRLQCPGPDQLDRDRTLRHALGRSIRLGLAEERGETAPEVPPGCSLAHRSRSSARRKISAASRI